MVRTTMIAAVNFLRTVNFSSGKLIYANAASIPMIFLDDSQENEDLINTRRDKYGDKPKMVMLNGLCNGKYMVSTHIVQLPMPSTRFQLPFVGTDDAEGVRR